MAPFEALVSALVSRVRSRHWTLLAVIMVSLATVAAATSGGSGPTSRVADAGAPTPVASVAAAPVLADQAPPAVPAPRFRSEVFTASVTHDLRYGRAPDAHGHPVDLHLDLYQPNGDTAPKRPAIVWAHGGAFAFGNKSFIPASALAERFARMGYVTVSIDYRLLAPSACGGTGGVVSPACFAAASAAADDAKAAVRWLRANAATYRIDPNRIGFGGDSAGGVLATDVGVQPEKQGNSGNPGYSDRVQAWMSFSGGVPGGLYVDRSDSPGLLIHGTADDVVPYSFSADTAAAMRRAGVPVELVPLPGAGHDPWHTYQGLVVSRSTDFFFRYLDLDSFSGFTG